MTTIDVYNRLKQFAECVLGITEEKLLNEMPFEIVNKIHNNYSLNKDDFVYFKDTYNINIAYLISGKLPQIRTDFTQLINGLLSKSQMNELTYISKEKLN